MNIKNELVSCVYDENAANINDKILEAFVSYLNVNLHDLISWQIYNLIIVNEKEMVSLSVKLCNK